MVSPEFSIIPRILYGPGVNETTPYVVMVNPVRFGQFLVGEFAIPTGELDEIEVMISNGIREDRLADAGYTWSMRKFKFINRINIFMGSILRSYPPERHRFLGRIFNRKSGWEDTREHLIGILAHESQHVQDQRREGGYYSQAILSLLGAGILSTAGDIFEGHRKNGIAKVTHTLDKAATIRSLAYVVKAVSSFPTQKRAEDAAKAINVAKWLNLVELRPNNKKTF